jgi:hypothetical protein
MLGCEEFRVEGLHAQLVMRQAKLRMVTMDEAENKMESRGRTRSLVRDGREVVCESLSGS